MNEYILKVMVWLKDKEFYSKEAMSGNAAAADAAYDDADAYVADDADAAYASVDAAAADDASAANWVDRYFYSSGDNKEEYEEEVKRRLLGKGEYNQGVGNE